MHDFTKDELGLLRDFCFAQKSKYTQNMPYRYLGDKLQSLIDNYCEHKRTYYSNGVKFSCNECKEKK